MKEPVKMVRLLEPSMCVGCRFAGMLMVDMTASNPVPTRHCKRGDCDNWDMSDVQTGTISEDKTGEQPG